jgi:uncharacterized membrane protein
VPGSINRRAVRWLRGQLPELVAAGAISPENASAIERHYGSVETRSNFAFVILATVGAALVGAGIILLIAHNWDDLSRAARTVIAFIPLLIAQALVVFVLLRRNESRPWREAVAVFDVAAVATAISLVSQTYQIQGTFADFMRVWLLLSIPIVYLLRTTLGAMLYLAGVIVWSFSREVAFFGRAPNPMFFWILFLLALPYFLIRYRQDRDSRETASLAIALTIALVVGLGFTADYAKSDLGCLAFAGLFTTIYLSGLKFFPVPDQRLHVVALLGGIGIGVTAVVLGFESSWHMTRGFFWGTRTLGANLAFALEFLFPIAAILLAALEILRRKIEFSFAAVVFPIVTAITLVIANLCDRSAERWSSTSCSFTAAAVMNAYALWLGIDILTRGIRSNSLARANFGLVIIAALGISRFFDSELSFVTRGLGFIVVGAGFLVANIILFRKRTAAAGA